MLLARWTVRFVWKKWLVLIIYQIGICIRVEPRSRIPRDIPIWRRGLIIRFGCWIILARHSPSRIDRFVYYQFANDFDEGLEPCITRFIFTYHHPASSYSRLAWISGFQIIFRARTRQTYFVQLHCDPQIQTICLVKKRTRISFLLVLQWQKFRHS